MTRIYKICSNAAWQVAETLGEFTGSEHDVRDGFIHFSTASQLPGTAAKYFAGGQDLVLVTIAADRLGPALRYEPSRGGELFPHLYAALPLDAVLAVAPLPLDENGVHDFSSALAE